MLLEYTSFWRLSNAYTRSVVKREEEGTAEFGPGLQEQIKQAWMDSCAPFKL
jgi:hypothetical protein